MPVLAVIENARSLKYDRAIAMGGPSLLWAGLSIVEARSSQGSAGDRSATREVFYAEGVGLSNEDSLRVVL